MMYKAFNGKIAFQIPEYFKPKQRITRHYHQSHEIHIFKPSSTEYLEIQFLGKNQTRITSC